MKRSLKIAVALAVFFILFFLYRRRSYYRISRVSNPNSLYNQQMNARAMQNYSAQQSQKAATNRPKR